MTHFLMSNMATGYPNSYRNGDYQKSASGSYKMKLFGIGSIKARPDVAIVTLGIVTENKELKTAQEENTLKTRSVIDSLERMDIREEDIKTQSFSITPEYDFVEGKKIFRGYRVVNNLEIRINNIEETGEIVDASVEAGANNVSDVKFTVKDPNQYYRNALNLAIEDAIKKVISIERRFNYKISKAPIKIEEQRLADVSLERVYLESTKVTTPIMPGEIGFESKIEAVFSYYV
ncbi:SIMPL domain-containing protein [Wukongibacter baidiensis]|uniref:SIMPL domain-containing protein n=1 Tax=Wukongibacter baidiensis TaxID=1723361 RepID=UPI003D7FCAD0